MIVKLPYRGGTFWHCLECKRRIRSAKSMRRHYWKHNTPLNRFFSAA